MFRKSIIVLIGLLLVSCASSAPETPVATDQPVETEPPAAAPTPTVPPSVEPQAAGDLTGRVWYLETYKDAQGTQAPLLAGSQITAEFGSDGTLSGSSGCNRYTDSYQVDSNQLQIGALASTMMACLDPAGLMEQETAYMQVLSNAASFRLADSKLELLDDDGQVTLIFSETVFEFIQTHPIGRALDIGCGTGTNVITLAKAGWQVTGFDFAPRAIKIARHKIKQANVQAELFTDDSTRMKNISGQFNLVLDIGCFHVIPNKVDYLTQLDRVLAPGGFWLMYGFLASSDDSSTPRIGPADLDRIQARGFSLLSRHDGLDKWERPSAWFLYQK